jgi:hypothetical protein
MPPLEIGLLPAAILASSDKPFEEAAKALAAAVPAAVQQSDEPRQRLANLTRLLDLFKDERNRDDLLALRDRVLTFYYQYPNRHDEDFKLPANVRSELEKRLVGLRKRQAARPDDKYIGGEIAEVEAAIAETDILGSCQHRELFDLVFKPWQQPKAAATPSFKSRVGTRHFDVVEANPFQALQQALKTPNAATIATGSGTLSLDTASVKNLSNTYVTAISFLGLFKTEDFAKNAKEQEEARDKRLLVVARSVLSHFYPKPVGTVEVSLQELIELSRKVTITVV